MIYNGLGVGEAALLWLQKGYEDMNRKTLGGFLLK
jgi:hypothetical protein